MLDRSWVVSISISLRRRTPRIRTRRSAAVTHSSRTVRLNTRVASKLNGLVPCAQLNAREHGQEQTTSSASVEPRERHGVRHQLQNTERKRLAVRVSPRLKKS